MRGRNDRFFAEEAAATRKSSTRETERESVGTHRLRSESRGTRARERKSYDSALLLRGRRVAVGVSVGVYRAKNNREKENEGKEKEDEEVMVVVTQR